MVNTDRFETCNIKNILVAAEGPAWSVKLADFGIATNVEDTWPSKDYIRTSGYMAPEMVDSPQYYTTAVDVWALGAVVFCLLVGIPHFHKLDDMLGYCAGIRQFPTSVLGASTELSIDFILNAMDPVPDKRMSIQKALNHKWLHVIEDASVVEHRYVRAHSDLAHPV